MKASARAAREDVIDFGMGNPDSATPQHVVDKLVEAVSDPRTHRYSTSRGIPGLRRANAAGVRFVAILGERELEAGQVALRDMLSGLQDDVALEDVVEAIQKRSAAAPK